jgi:hypothetical protein
MSSTPYDRVFVWYWIKTIFLELFWYALHLNTKKLEINNFMFGLNSNFCVKGSILMPQMLHDEFQ